MVSISRLILSDVENLSNQKIDPCKTILVDIKRTLIARIILKRRN